MRARERTQRQQVQRADRNADVETVLVLNTVDPALPVPRGRGANVQQRLSAIDRIGNVAGLLVGKAELGPPLDEDLQSEFVENRPIVAKNVGTLRSWRRLAER